MYTALQTHFLQLTARNQCLKFPSWKGKYLNKFHIMATFQLESVTCSVHENVLECQTWGIKMSDVLVETVLCEKQDTDSHLSCEWHYYTNTEYANVSNMTFYHCCLVTTADYASCYIKIILKNLIFFHEILHILSFLCFQLRHIFSNSMILVGSQYVSTGISVVLRYFRVEMSPGPGDTD